jgi:hypothetical protein
VQWSIESKKEWEQVLFSFLIVYLYTWYYIQAAFFYISITVNESQQLSLTWCHQWIFFSLIYQRCTLTFFFLPMSWFDDEEKHRVCVSIYGSDRSSWIGKERRVW